MAERLHYLPRVDLRTVGEEESSHKILVGQEGNVVDVEVPPVSDLSYLELFFAFLHCHLRRSFCLRASVFELVQILCHPPLLRFLHSSH